MYLHQIIYCPLLGGSSRGNVHRYTGRFFLTPNIHLGLEKSVRYNELSPILNFIRNGRRGTEVVVTDSFKGGRRDLKIVKLSLT